MVYVQSKEGLPLMPTRRHGQRYRVKGVQNRVAYIKLDGLAKPVKTSAVKLLYYGKGLCVL